MSSLTTTATLAAAASAAPAPVLRFENVGKTYAPRRGGSPVEALGGIDLAVARGAIQGLIGRSGAGKSTLVRLVNGLETPTSGRVLVDGRDIGGLGGSDLNALRRRIGMVFQHFNLLTRRTVAGNIALPLEIAGVPAKRIAERVAELLPLVGLEALAARYPAELSGGQKQRVGIARALATEPAILLADEATSALDPETTRQILSLLADINGKLGLTILIITHEMKVVAEIAHRVAVIDHGRIVEEGAVYDVFTRPQHPTTRTLVAEVTGIELPAHVARRLQPSPIEGGQAVVRITFTGPEATTPVLSSIARDLGLDINILAGRIDTLGGRPFGTLVVGLPSGEPYLTAALDRIGERGLLAEVIGHVA